MNVEAIVGGLICFLGILLYFAGLRVIGLFGGVSLALYILEKLGWGTQIWGWLVIGIFGITGVLLLPKIERMVVRIGGSIIAGLLIFYVISDYISSIGVEKVPISLIVAKYGVSFLGGVVGGYLALALRKLALMGVSAYLGAGIISDMYDLPYLMWVLLFSGFIFQFLLLRKFSHRAIYMDGLLSQKLREAKKEKIKRRKGKEVEVFIGVGHRWNIPWVRRELRRLGGKDIGKGKYDCLGYIYASIPVDQLEKLRRTWRADIVALYDIVSQITVPPPDILNFRKVKAGNIGESIEKVKTYKNKRLPSHIPGTNIPFDGKGVKVAVLDTGVDTDHPGLRGKIARAVDFADTGSPKDKFGHGTHVTGIIAGELGNFVGMAPGVEIYSAKVLDDLGYGTWRSILDGLFWAVNEGVEIINMSLGGGKCGGDCPACRAVDWARKKGVLVVVSAGNSGPSKYTVTCPGNSRGAVTVGAWDGENGVAKFSSRGPTLDGRIKPELVAPGVNVLSFAPGGGFQLASGTSMSAPHVSGGAALILQWMKVKKRQVVVKRIVRRIERCVRLRRTDIYSQGKGVLNLVKAVEDLQGL